MAQQGIQEKGRVAACIGSIVLAESLSPFSAPTSPPASRAYRARSVRDPRGLLAEFGTQLAPGTAIRVHDSTADLRYGQTQQEYCGPLVFYLPWSIVQNLAGMKPCIDLELGREVA